MNMMDVVNEVFESWLVSSLRRHNWFRKNDEKIDDVVLRRTHGMDDVR